MASVRRSTCVEPGKVYRPSKLRPPTDATQSRPYLDAPANHPVSGFPLSVVISSRHLPPGAATRHLRMDTARAARGAAPTCAASHEGTCWHGDMGARGDGI